MALSPQLELELMEPHVPASDDGDDDDDHDDDDGAGTDRASEGGIINNDDHKRRRKEGLGIITNVSFHPSDNLIISFSSSG